MVYLTLHRNATDSYTLLLTDFPEYLFNGFCPGAIEYVEYGPLDDILGTAERLMAPDDTYRLFTLSRIGKDQYGIQVIRGAEHLNEYLSQLKDHVPLCKGPLKIVRDILLCVPAPGVDPAKIPYSPYM